jgi:hypothetical protein
MLESSDCCHLRETSATQQRFEDTVITGLIGKGSETTQTDGDASGSQSEKQPTVLQLRSTPRSAGQRRFLLIVIMMIAGDGAGNQRCPGGRRAPSIGRRFGGSSLIALSLAAQTNAANRSPAG